jgi:hydrogenase expression/formation protein HypD
MKYIGEFRDGTVARNVAGKIAREAQKGRRYRLMEFCGGHTHSLWRYGLMDMLPPEV